MAKELPYFKFEPNQWDSGMIQLCGYKSKGIFIEMCCLYWSRLGDLPYALALQKICNGDSSVLEELEKNKIYIVESGNIIINFLEEQLNVFSETSDKRRAAANKRWKNASEMQVQSKSNAIREKEKREDKKYISVFTFDDFWNLYPKKVAKTKCKPKFNKLSESDKDKILETLKDFIAYKPFENYIHPNPETYLNQKRWEDELPTTIKNNDGLKVGDIDPKSGRPILFFTEDGRPVIKPNSDKPTHYNK